MMLTPEKLLKELEDYVREGGAVYEAIPMDKEFLERLGFIKTPCSGDAVTVTYVGMNQEELFGSSL